MLRIWKTVSRAMVSPITRRGGGGHFIPLITDNQAIYSLSNKSYRILSVYRLLVKYSFLKMPLSPNAYRSVVIKEVSCQQKGKGSLEWLVLGRKNLRSYSEAFQCIELSNLRIRVDACNI
jgi:hypothetical protein